MLKSPSKAKPASLGTEACVNLRSMNVFPLLSWHSLSETAINPPEQGPAVFQLWRPLRLGVGRQTECSKCLFQPAVIRVDTAHTAENSRRQSRCGVEIPVAGVPEEDLGMLQKKIITTANF